MIVWGLTGNIACGKSTVEGMLREASVAVIDADQVARDVVAPGEPALGEIVERFGEHVLHDDGSLDRPALGAIVFADPSARAALEAITHPRIHQRTFELLTDLSAQGVPLAVVSAALMIESGSSKNYAGLLVVTCPEEAQLQRLRSRDDFSEADALARIRSQMPQAEKAAQADHVIDNSGNIEATRAQLETWLAKVGQPSVFSPS